MVAERVYYSLGGENWVQAIWLIPVTNLGVKVRFDRLEINKIYAATASYADSPKGYDAISAALYRSRFCSLSRERQKVVEFLTYPLPQLVQTDPDLRRESENAAGILQRHSEQQRLNR
jgi:hypothetical protein